MSTTPGAPDDQRRRELACIIEALSGQSQALTNSGGHEAERVSALDQATCQLQDSKKRSPALLNYKGPERKVSTNDTSPTQ